MPHRRHHSFARDDAVDVHVRLRAVEARWPPRISRTASPSIHRSSRAYRPTASCQLNHSRLPGHVERGSAASFKSRPVSRARTTSTFDVWWVHQTNQTANPEQSVEATPTRRSGHAQTPSRRRGVRRSQTKATRQRAAEAARRRCSIRRLPRTRRRSATPAEPWRQTDAGSVQLRRTACRRS